MTDWEAVTRRVSDATYDAWNAHDAEAVAAVFAADARTRDAGTEAWEVGRDAVRARARFGQAVGHGAAQHARRAGDDGHFAVQGKALICCHDLLVSIGFPMIDVCRIRLSPARR